MSPDRLRLRAVTDLSIDDVIPLHVADVRIPEIPSGHPVARHSGTMGAVMAFAVVQARGVTLFETGVGQPHLPTLPSTFGAWLHERNEVVVRPMDRELARHGLGVGDVRAIVNSHLHWDHCGGNPLFPGVPIYVQAAECEAARRGGQQYTVPEWVDFPGAEFVMIDGDATVGRGIKVLATPGHTVGHQSLVIETREGRVALAGQAVYLREEYEQIVAGQSGYGGGVVPEHTLSSARRIIDEQPTRVHFSHDRAVWHIVPEPSASPTC
jgi:glyoxylase-like metal-dependent hydrolase (beta-lactamase superfamily II)